MIYGETREMVEKARATFVKKWRLDGWRAAAGTALPAGSGLTVLPPEST